jgi:hypothetical protein
MSALAKKHKSAYDLNIFQEQHRQEDIPDDRLQGAYE